MPMAVIVEHAEFCQITALFMEFARYVLFALNCLPSTNNGVRQLVVRAVVLRDCVQRPGGYQQPGGHKHTNGQQAYSGERWEGEGEGEGEGERERERTQSRPAAARQVVHAVGSWHILSYRPDLTLPFLALLPFFSLSLPAAPAQTLCSSPSLLSRHRGSLTPQRSCSSKKHSKHS